MTELKIEYIPIDSITPYEANAKLHPPEQIAQIKKSIQDYGFRDPVGIWKGEIVEGHGRIIAAIELGLTEVPVIKLDDMTDEQRREYALVHNQTTLNSGFDFSALDAEIEGLPEFDAEFYGFDYDEQLGYFSSLSDEGSASFSAEQTGLETFNITFVFPIEKQAVVLEYIKTNSKQFLVDMIIQKAEGRNAS